MKGYAQKLKINFDEIFLPVAHLITIRVVLAIATVKPEQIDMKTAFLHGDLKEEIYMSQCESFVEKGKQDLVCLYGLKRAPRCWSKRFDSFIESLGFYRLEADHYAYFCIYDDGKFCIL